MEWRPSKKVRCETPTAGAWRRTTCAAAAGLSSLVAAIALCLIAVAAAGCFQDPQDPPGFVYSCSGTTACPPNQACGRCTAGQLNTLLVCGPLPAGAMVTCTWVPLATMGALTGAADPLQPAAAALGLAGARLSVHDAAEVDLAAGGVEVLFATDLDGDGAEDLILAPGGGAGGDPAGSGAVGRRDVWVVPGGAALLAAATAR
jgi:hypothetical protein